MSDLDPMHSARPCITVPIPPGPGGLDVLLSPLRRALAGTGPAIAPLPAQAPSGLRERLLRALRPDDPVPGGVAAILATSGSTADPRGVLLPTSAIASAATALGRALGRAPGGHQWVAALPLHSAGGFMVVARAILAGVPPVPMSSLGGARRFSIDDLAAATADAQRRSLRDGLPLAISVVPTMLARVIEAGQDAIDVLARYDLVLVGGSAADPGVLASLRSAGVGVRASYGMTETCGGAVLDGVPLPGVDVRVDPDGHVRISGRQVALGYRGGGRSADWSTGAGGFREFRTSDVGRVEDGLVVLRGRADEIVQVSGTSVDLAAICRVIRADPDVADAELVALPDAVWGAQVIAVIVPRPGITEDAATVPRPATSSEPSTTANATADTAPSAAQRALPPGMAERLAHAVGETLGPSAQPRRLVMLDAIPQLPAGKPDRRALLRLLAVQDARAAAAGQSAQSPGSTDGALSSRPEGLGRIAP